MGLSIIVPAYNEEKNLGATLEWITDFLERKNFSGGYEVLIFNDFSSDKTGEIADAWAKKDTRIKVFHNSSNMGFGYNYRKGVEEARGEYAMMIPGDNENSNDSIWNLFEAMGKADLILSYAANPELRPFYRRLISWIYVKEINFLFNLNLKYYNGITLNKTQMIKRVLPKTFGFAFCVEILVPLLKSGVSYVEVPFILNPTEGKTSAFKIKNVASVIKTIASLFWRINIKRERITFNY